MNCLFIYNPVSGRGKIARRLPGIVRALRQKYDEVDVYATSGKGDMTRAVRAAASRYGAIVFSGGDGSFNETVQGVCESGMAPELGYIPSGTVNDVAHSLGISKNIRRALEILEGVSVLPDGNAEQDSSAGEKPEYPDAASPGNRQEEAGGGGEGFPEDAFLYGSASDTASGWDWYVLPFRRPFGGRVCTGSLRFLLHRFTGEAAETRITVRDGGSCADFHPEPANRLFGSLLPVPPPVCRRRQAPVPAAKQNGSGCHPPENLPVKPVDIEV